MTPEQAAAAAQTFRDDYAAVRDQVSRVVVGQAGVIDGVLTCLFVGGHVLLEGVPGVGKTLLVRTLARAVDLQFSRIQFTPDLMPADITGTMVVSELETQRGRERQFVFQRGPVFAQVLLADEINRATPKTQSALLEAMQERGVTVAGATHRLPEPFLVLATQNPVEQEGTYPLPEAQLDRFMFKLLTPAPGAADLALILDRTTGAAEGEARPALSAEALLRHQSLVRRVPVAPHVRDYAVRLAIATQPAATLADAAGHFRSAQVERYVRLGASPRGAQSLVLAAKCRALMEGRFAASTDDVRWAALPALRHRLIMNFESHAEGVNADSVIGALLETLPREAA
ncbi:MAG TPA: AAA family ATPase [Phycisphaerales bacterium]|nr:AAA family ATPase [Phycisphaerales bacterium]